MAAFALGLIGDTSAEAALTPLLADTVAARARPRGRSARPDRRDRSGAGDRQGRRRVRAERPPSRRWRRTTRRGRRHRRPKPFKLALFALVRLKAYDPLAAAVLERRSAGLDLVAGRLRAAADRAIRARRRR